MKTFFAVLFIMGAVLVPEVWQYWSENKVPVYSQNFPLFVTVFNTQGRNWNIMQIIFLASS
jgi:hypothetical protein